MSGTPTSASVAASPTASETGGLCTEESILASLPEGAKLQEFQCALGSPYMWAAARVMPGPKVYFMRSNNGPWTLVKTSQACGSGPTRAPEELTAICPKS